jgi:hypothetical protein
MNKGVYIVLQKIVDWLAQHPEIVERRWIPASAA